MFRNRQKLVRIGIWVIVVAMLLPLVAIVASGF